LRESHLPLEKNLDSFDLDRMPAKVRQQITTLLDGTFLDRLLVQNLLIAKQNLKLSRIIKHLSKYDSIIIDDIG
jgi:hypothetical protein